MRRDRTVLVIGATGNVGRHVVAGLLEEGARVRALVRRPLTAALPGDVSVTQGDLERPETVATAAEGADAAFLLWPGFSSAGASDVVTELARHVAHVVYLSAARLQHGAEGAMPGVWSDLERLIEASGLSWTFVRAGGFAANTLEWADQIRSGDTVRIPYPNAARSLVHERDTADVAVRCLVDPGHAGRALAVTGPHVLTQLEQVRAIGAAIGRELQVEEQPADSARRRYEAVLGAEYADGALAYWASLVDAPERATGDVESVTGRPARTFAQWARDHAADFARRSTAEVADAYAASFRTGQIDRATSLLAPDFVRVAPQETDGREVELRGVAAVMDNAERQSAHAEINAVDVGDPLVNGDQFAIRFSFDETDRASGRRQTTTKLSLYTVEASRIVREEVFYYAPPAI
jgi:uncharacterized protein YbjT (DUF2867 family)/ketosteroid isomerase-like protein